MLKMISPLLSLDRLCRCYTVVVIRSCLDLVVEKFVKQISLKQSIYIYISVCVMQTRAAGLLCYVSLVSLKLPFLSFFNPSIDGRSVSKSFSHWNDLASRSESRNKTCSVSGWHWSWPAALCFSTDRWHWNGTAAEARSVGCVLCCNPAVELGITVCGCAFDKMATPEKAVTIIPLRLTA